MCVVSLVSAWGRDNIPNLDWWQRQLQPFAPSPSPDPVILKELREQREILDKFMAMLDAAKAFDTVSGQPDCEEESKTAWLTEVKDRLARIEQQLSLSGGAV